MGSGHQHNHANGHGHSHAPADFGRAFAIGVVLNSAFVVVEATYGFLSGSMALVADAGHNLSDVLALMLAWGASIAAKKPPSPRFTYGFKSSTILAALANAMLLALAIGAILFETIHRFIDPAPVQGMTMVVVAGIGIVINTATALMFMRGRKNDLNIRGAFDPLHRAGVDRSCHQPDHRGGDRLGHLGPGEGQHQAGPARCSRHYRCRRRARASGRVARG